MKKAALVTLLLLIAISVFVLTDRDRAVWVLNTAIKTVESRTVHADIVYGDRPWQTLDVYPAADDNAPVLVFIHGGGWYHGRKDQYYFAADAFLRVGYTVVIHDYIKYPASEAIFPAHVVDAAKALAWTKANIARFNGDPNNLFIAGHSAGAHTAALLTTDPRYLEATGLSKSDLRGYAGIAGPYAFIPDTTASMAVFGPESNYAKIDPLQYIDGTEAATLILHSDDDKRIANRHPRDYEAAAQKANGDFAMRIYTDLSHIDMVTHLHPWLAGSDTLAKDIDQFFRSRLVDADSKDAISR